MGRVLQLFFTYYCLSSYHLFESISDDTALSSRHIFISIFYLAVE